jgi:hypothetical protein
MYVFTRSVLFICSCTLPYVFVKLISREVYCFPLGRYLDIVLYVILIHAYISSI